MLCSVYSADVKKTLDALNLATLLKSLLSSLIYITEPFHYRSLAVVKVWSNM